MKLSLWAVRKALNECTIRTSDGTATVYIAQHLSQLGYRVSSSMVRSHLRKCKMFGEVTSSRPRGSDTYWKLTDLGREHLT